MTKAKNDSTMAARDFTDAGTGKSFQAGKPIEATEGELENYRAAGLIGDPETAADATSAQGTTQTKADPATKPNA